MHVWPDAQPAVGPAYSTALFADIARLAEAIPPERIGDPVGLHPTRGLRVRRRVSAIGNDRTHARAGEARACGSRARLSPVLWRLRAQAWPAAAEPCRVCRDRQRHRRSGVVDRSTGSICPSRATAMTWRTSSRCAICVWTRTRACTSAWSTTRTVLDGTLRRMEVASSVFPEFGIATECGMGRRVGQNIPELLRIHAQASDHCPCRAITS